MTKVYALKRKPGFAEAFLDGSIYEHWTADLEIGTRYNGDIEPIPISLSYEKRKGFVVGNLIYSMHLGLLATQSAIDELELKSDAFQLFPTFITDVSAEKYSSREDDPGSFQNLDNKAAWFLVHPIKQIDALDYQETICSGVAFGMPGGIIKYGFNTVEFPRVFCAKYDTELLGSKALYDLFKSKTLTGVTLKLIWDDKKGGRWQQPEYVVGKYFAERLTLAEAVMAAEDQLSEIEDSQNPLKGAPDFVREMMNELKPAVGKKSVKEKLAENTLPLERLPQYREAATQHKKFEPTAPGFVLPACSRLQFTHEGLWVLRQKTVSLWSLKSGNIIKSFSLPLSNSDFVVSPDGLQIAVKDTSGNLALIKSENGDLLWKPKRMPYEGRGCDPAFSPDGRYLVDGTGDGSIRVYAIDSGELMHLEQLGHDYMVSHVSFDLNNSIIVVLHRKACAGLSAHLGNHILKLDWQNGTRNIIENNWGRSLYGEYNPNRDCMVVWSDSGSDYDTEKGRLNSLYLVHIASKNVRRIGEYWIQNDLQRPSFGGDYFLLGLENGITGCFSLQSCELIKKIKWGEHQAAISEDLHWVALTGSGPFCHGVVIPFDDSNQLGSHGEKVMWKEKAKFRSYCRIGDLRKINVHRVIIYATQDKWIIEKEKRLEDCSGYYLGYEPATSLKSIDLKSSKEELGQTIYQCLNGDLESHSPEDREKRRRLGSSAWKSPIEGLKKALYLTFAPDMIEIWRLSLKKKKTVVADEGWPCFPWPNQLTPEQLGAAVLDAL